MAQPPSHAVAAQAALCCTAADCSAAPKLLHKLIAAARKPANTSYGPCPARAFARSSDLLLLLLQLLLLLRVCLRSCPGGALAPLAHVHLSLLADQVGEAAANTADGSDGVHHLLLAINVGVQHTQNVLEVISGNEGLVSTRKDRMCQNMHRNKSGAAAISATR